MRGVRPALSQIEALLRVSGVVFLDPPFLGRVSGLQRLADLEHMVVEGILPVETDSVREMPPASFGGTGLDEVLGPTALPCTGGKPNITATGIGVSMTVDGPGHEGRYRPPISPVP